MRELSLDFHCSLNRTKSRMLRDWILHFEPSKTVAIMSRASIGFKKPHSRTALGDDFTEFGFRQCSQSSR